MVLSTISQPSPTTRQVIILKPLMSALRPPQTQPLHQPHQQAWKLLMNLRGGPFTHFSSRLFWVKDTARFAFIMSIIPGKLNRIPTLSHPTPSFLYLFPLKAPVKWSFEIELGKHFWVIPAPPYLTPINRNHL